MKKYIIPVRINMTKYHLFRLVVAYASSECQAIEKALDFVNFKYSVHKCFDGCFTVRDCVISELCETQFID